MFQHAHEEELRGGCGLADGFGLPAFDGLDVQDVIAEPLLGDVGRIALTELVDQAHLAVIGMAGARGVELQGEKLGEAAHRGIRMRVVIERIALGTLGERPVSVGQPLAARFVGALRRFGLALAAVLALMGLVVGVGVVFAFHSPATMTTNPATIHPAHPPQSRKSHRH